MAPLRPALALLALAVPLLATAPSARAQLSSDEERGRLHFQAGASYYEAGDYEDALREFERAWELSQRAELFFNLSLCHQQLGHLPEAIDYLARFLSEVENIENRANLERRLENLRERQAEAEAEAAAQPDQADEADDEPSLATPSPAPGAGPNVGAIASFAAAGVGVVMLGVGGGLALAEKGDLEDRGCPDATDGEPCDVSALRTRAAIADVGLGLTVVGAALGVVLLLVGGGEDDPEAEAGLRLDPWMGRTGGGAVVRGAF